MDGFIGEIRMFPYLFTPLYWLPCDGREVAIYEYQALYAVIGSTFGSKTPGTSFTLPDLRGATAVCAGSDPLDAFDPAFASTGGAATVTLSDSTIPSHDHEMQGATLAQRLRVESGTGNYVSGATLVTGTPPTQTIQNTFSFAPLSAGTPVTLNQNTLAPFNGANGPHENRQPYLVLPYFICTYGDFPIRN